MTDVFDEEQRPTEVHNGVSDDHQKVRLAGLMRRDSLVRNAGGASLPTFKEPADLIRMMTQACIAPAKFWFQMYTGSFLQPAGSTKDFSLLSDVRGMDRMERVSVPKEAFFQYLEYKHDDACHMFLGGSLQMLKDNGKVDDEMLASWMKTGTVPDAVQDMLLTDPKVKQLIDAASAFFTPV